MSVTHVSSAQEAGYFLNALAWVAEAGSETSTEISRIRDYYNEFRGQFGQRFIDNLKGRIYKNELSPRTMDRIDSWENWSGWNAGYLVNQVDDPREAGFLINALAWVSEGSGFTHVEYDRMASYFNEYENKFGYSFIDDLQSRIYNGELSADTMRRIAPGYRW